MSSLGSDVRVPYQRVVMYLDAFGPRGGKKNEFILRCGHRVVRPVSMGVPLRMHCYECWRIAVCDKDGCLSCVKCAKARKVKTS